MRQLRNKERGYTVEAEGRVLIEWLNGMADTPGGRRLARLVENIQRLLAIETARWKSFPELGCAEEIRRPSRRERQESQRLMGDIQRELKRCKTHPSICDPVLGPIIAWEKHGWYRFTVLRIAKLANEGLLNRVRRCQECSKWLFARLSGQRFCSHACRQCYYQANPLVRAHRRRYMAAYRSQFPSRRAIEKTKSKAQLTSDRRPSGSSK